MNLLKLNMKQSIFTSIIMIASVILALIILPWKEYEYLDVVLYTCIISVLAAFIGGIISKIFFK